MQASWFGSLPYVAASHVDTGTLDVARDAAVGGGLDVSGTLSVVRDVDVSGNLDVSGVLTCARHSVNNDTTVLHWYVTTLGGVGCVPLLVPNLTADPPQQGPMEQWPASFLTVYATALGYSVPPYTALRVRASPLPSILLDNRGSHNANFFTEMTVPLNLIAASLAVMR